MTPEHTPTGQNERRGVHWAGDSLEQQMGNPTIGACTLSNIQNHFLFPQIPSLQTTTAYWIYRIGPQHQSLGGMSNERSYLLENLRRQHDRGQRLSHALCNIETRLASAQSKGEARKLRKEAGLLKSKIAESNKQEQLIAMRLNDLHNEDSARLYQTHQPGLLPYPYSPVQPWGQMTLSPMTTMTPVSPLTPLPPGIYHPSPIPPSPLEPPYFLASPFLVYNPVISHEQNFLEGEQQGLYTPGQHDSASPVLANESRRKSVEHKATRTFEDVLSEQGHTGRRWSLADAFSPSPRDKRMSMPGLQTLWRY